MRGSRPRGGDLWSDAGEEHTATQSRTTAPSFYEGSPPLSRSSSSYNRSISPLSAAPDASTGGMSYFAEEALTALSHITNIVKAASHAYPELLETGNTDQPANGLLGARQQLIEWLTTHSSQPPSGNSASSQLHSSDSDYLSSAPSSASSSGIALSVRSTLSPNSPSSSSTLPPSRSEREWSQSTIDDYRDYSASWGTSSGMENLGESSEENTPRSSSNADGLLRPGTSVSFDPQGGTISHASSSSYVDFASTFGSLDASSLMPPSKRSRLLPLGNDFASSSPQTRVSGPPASPSFSLSSRMHDNASSMLDQKNRQASGGTGVATPLPVVHPASAPLPPLPSSATTHNASQSPQPFARPPQMLGAMTYPAPTAAVANVPYAYATASGHAQQPMFVPTAQWATAPNPQFHLQAQRTAGASSQPNYSSAPPHTGRALASTPPTAHVQTHLAYPTPVDARLYPPHPHSFPQSQVGSAVHVAPVPVQPHPQVAVYDPPLVTKTVSKTGRPLPPVSTFRVNPSKSTPLPQVDPTAPRPKGGHMKTPASLASIIAPGLMDTFDWRTRPVSTANSKKRTNNASSVTPAAAGPSASMPIAPSMTSPSYTAMQQATPPPQQLQNAKLEDFAILNILGTGTFGKVHLCVHRGTGMYYCLKILKKQTIYRFKQMDHVENEKQILLQLRHPGIVQLYATFTTQDALVMLMEYVPGGELFYYIRRFGRLAEDIARLYAAELVCTLLHLHERNIVYRDLKPENILLDTSGHLKLADFGFAKRVVHKTWTMCGTPDYLAPEIISGKGHDTAVDWWSLGVLIFEMLAGFPPFTDKDMGVLFRKIQEPEKLVMPPEFSQDAADLIRRLLVIDPTSRLGNIHPDITDIRSHPWFRPIDWDRIVQRNTPGPIAPVLQNPADIGMYQDKQTDEPQPPIVPIPEDVQRIFDRF